MLDSSSSIWHNGMDEVELMLMHEVSKRQFCYAVARGGLRLACACVPPCGPARARTACVNGRGFTGTGGRGVVSGREGLGKGPRRAQEQRKGAAEGRVAGGSAKRTAGRSGGRGRHLFPFGQRGHWACCLRVGSGCGMRESRGLLVPVLQHQNHRSEPYAIYGKARKQNRGRHQQRSRGGRTG